MWRWVDDAAATLTAQFTAALLTAVALFVVVCGYYYCTSTHGKWKSLGVPYVRPVVPLFGNSWRVAIGREHVVDAFNRFYARLAGHRYGGIYQFRTPYLMIRDPELVNRVLVGDSSYFPDHGVYTNLRANPFSANLFFMEGSRWHAMRAKLNPAFTSSKLRAAYEQIARCTAELMRNIDGRLLRAFDAFDVRDVMSKYATDVIGECAFGIRMNAIGDESSEFHEYGKKVLRPSLKTFVRVACQMISPRLFNALRFQDFPRDSVRFYESVIRATFKHREQEQQQQQQQQQAADDSDGRRDIVYYLMRAKYDLVTDPSPDSKDVFTETDIAANAFFLFVAGFETVSLTLSLCLYELALRKDYQDRAREEIRSKKAEYGGVVDNDYLSSLSYVDQVLSETLRRYPPTIALFRVAAQTYRVPDDSLIIEKGQQLIIPVHSLHNDPEYYPDPEVFDPERFSPEQTAKRPSGTYLPFGDGPRICIGKRFAMIEIKMALADILSKYEVEPCEKTEIPITFCKGTLMGMFPKNGVWLKFKNIV